MQTQTMHSLKLFSTTCQGHIRQPLQRGDRAAGTTGASGSRCDGGLSEGKHRVTDGEERYCGEGRFHRSPFFVSPAITQISASRRMILKRFRPNNVINYKHSVNTPPVVETGRAKCCIKIISLLADHYRSLGGPIHAAAWMLHQGPATGG